MTTVAAMFDTHAEAETAVHRLVEAGLPKEGN